ncbi:MAG: hypothetical protein IKF52_04430 [Clostridia bacterium]|nr:hypothetical protein [Clostridia bacterium]
MENVSHALLIAGETLIGVLLLTIFVIVFRNGGQLGSSYDKRIESEAIKAYNAPFTSLLAISDDSKNQKITIYDIVSVTNYAISLNSDEDNNHIDVYLKIDSSEEQHFEKKQQKDLHNYIKQYSTYSFKVTEIKYNDFGKVVYIGFEKI